MAQFQALLKRNPSLNQEEFNNHWYTKHAPLVVPYFLSGGITYYAQVHGPLSIAGPLESSVTVGDWSGAAEVAQGPGPASETEPQWKKDYYQEIILPDERRFLVSEALDHMLQLAPNIVEGDRKVIIQDGKSLIDIPEEVMAVFKDYQRRGKKENVGEIGEGI